MDIESVVETKSLQLLDKAIHFGASDLHILPTTADYMIHFRRYGKLFPAGSIPFDLGDRMISYFKFLSSLDISERRKPQSGSFQRDFQEQYYSFRVSTLPSVFRRESLVIRLMLQNSRYPITSLCFSPVDADKLTQLVSNRQGLLLFCGPTDNQTLIQVHKFNKIQRF